MSYTESSERPVVSLTVEGLHQRFVRVMSRILAREALRELTEESRPQEAP